MASMGSTNDFGAFGVGPAFAAPALKKSSKSSTDDFVDEDAAGIVAGDFCGFGVDVDVLEAVVSFASARA